ncbi:hypothetical protein CPC08DRAFT_715702 [Agrocybe pediades]|nr:hypothetical protein CPC08DRAFT_715702 [Agrocybe pediades]
MDFTYHASSNAREITSSPSYARKMHGMERLLATVAERVHGFGHLFMGYHLLFQSSEPTCQSMCDTVRTAWIHTRFIAPWIAIRTTTVAEEKNSWFQVYDEPSATNMKPVNDWADATILWREEMQGLSEWESCLKERFWTPSAGRFGVELHVAKAPEEGYFIMASIGHWIADGRGALQVIELFFRNLQKEFSGNTIPVHLLPWGSELERLCPATVEALDVGHVETQHCPLLPEISHPPSPSSLHRKSGKREFIRPLLEVPRWEHLSARQTHIRLSRAETTAFHDMCAQRRANSTALISAISILADVETAFHVARAHGGDKACQKVFDDFMAAEIYTIAENMADRRSLLCRKLPAVSAPGGFGNNVCEVFPTTHNMEHIRNCVKFNSDPTTSNQCTKLVDIRSNVHFWEGLVGETEKQLKANKKTTPEAFAITERATEASVPFFRTVDHFLPGVLCTSIGRLSSLGLFTSFLPSSSTANNTNDTFTIPDILLGTRATGPDVQHVAVMSFEYNDRLTINLAGSPRWHSDDAWEFYVKSVRKSFEVLLEGKAKL